MSCSRFLKGRIWKFMFIIIFFYFTISSDWAMLETHQKNLKTFWTCNCDWCNISITLAHHLHHSSTIFFKNCYIFLENAKVTTKSLQIDITINVIVAIFILFYYFYNSIVDGGGIWILNVSVRNTDRCQSFKAISLLLPL